MSIDDILSDMDKVLSSAESIDPLLLRQMTSAIESIFSFVLGILIVLIFIGIPCVTALDVAYICMPVFRNKISEKNYGQPGKIRFISNDAIKAIEESYLSDGKSALAIYLRKRLWTYLIVAAVLTVVCLGGWDYVLAWVNYFAVVIANIIVQLTA